jgi:hypothetical protein
MQTRLSIDLRDPRLARLVRLEAEVTDSSLREVCVRALESYLAHKLETRALLKACEAAFDEWNDPRDADYDSL